MGELRAFPDATGRQARAWREIWTQCGAYVREVHPAALTMPRCIFERRLAEIEPLMRDWWFFLTSPGDVVADWEQPDFLSGRLTAKELEDLRVTIGAFGDHVQGLREADCKRRLRPIFITFLQLQLMRGLSPATQDWCFRQGAPRGRGR